MNIMRWATLPLIVSAPALAQWELGGTGGYSAYRNDLTVQNRNGGSAQIGFRPGMSFGVIGGLNDYRYLSGEARYLYQRSEMSLESGSTEVRSPAHTHIVHFDVLVHSSPRGSGVRPFFAIGAGFKLYQGTGVDRAAQPLSDFAVLTRTRQMKPIASPGAGVKWQIAPRVQLRTELRYYISPVPDKLLTPAVGGRLTGWLHDIVPSVGILATF